MDLDIAIEFGAQLLPERHRAAQQARAFLVVGGKVAVGALGLVRLELNVKASRVGPRRLGVDIAAIDDDRLDAIASEKIGGRTADDAAADHKDVRFGPDLAHVFQCFGPRHERVFYDGRSEKRSMEKPLMSNDGSLPRTASATSCP